MLIAVISDIHSNLAAFEASAEEFENVDQVWCLGDIVGYGPQPNESLEFLKKFSYQSVAGNHDLGAVGKISLRDFNLEGQRALSWTTPRLKASSLLFLEALPLKLIPLPEVTLIHGSPREPVWEYIHTLDIAEANFSYFTTLVCFFGHTHFPVILKKLPGKSCQIVQFREDEEVFLMKEAKWLINPGSIGQPRDGNPNASFILFDSEKFSVKYKRVPYDIKRTQEIMRQSRLPSLLIQRLSVGI